LLKYLKFASNISFIHKLFLGKIFSAHWTALILV